MITPINVLQIGEGIWSVPIAYQEVLKWTQCGSDDLTNLVAEDRQFDLIILEEALEDQTFAILSLLASPYRVWIDRQLISDLSIAGQLFCQKMQARIEDLRAKDTLIEQIVHSYFPRPYGEKLIMNTIFFNEQLVDSKVYYGNNYINISGIQTKDYVQIAGWKQTIYKDPNRNLEFWLEYMGSASLSLQLKVYEWDQYGNLLQEINLALSGRDPLIVESKRYQDGTYLTVNLWGQGQGDLCLGALHWRHSLENGHAFIPGGQRFVAKDRSEFFYYFSPGNLKPPLNVYFSGYRPQEGFEGYFMMKDLEHPFILFSDPRVEGGAFYLGRPDYEQAILQVIQGQLNQLGFKANDLILSGLSMGTFAALYYGCQLQPHAIIIGKPLVHIDLIARRTALERPNDFLTILDIVQRNQNFIADELDPDLDQKLFEKLDQAQLSQTIVAIAYMLQDDYDNQARNQLLAHLSKQGSHIITKALEGRHNDDSPGIFEWFISQYRRILANDFREEEADD